MALSEKDIRMLTLADLRGRIRVAAAGFCEADPARRALRYQLATEAMQLALADLAERAEEIGIDMTQIQKGAVR